MLPHTVPRPVPATVPLVASGLRVTAYLLLFSSLFPCFSRDWAATARSARKMRVCEELSMLFVSCCRCVSPAGFLQDSVSSLMPSLDESTFLSPRVGLLASSASGRGVQQTHWTRISLLTAVKGDDDQRKERRHRKDELVNRSPAPASRPRLFNLHCFNVPAAAAGVLQRHWRRTLDSGNSNGGGRAHKNQLLSPAAAVALSLTERVCLCQERRVV